MAIYEASGANASLILRSRSSFVHRKALSDGADFALELKLFLTQLDFQVTLCGNEGNPMRQGNAP